MIASGPLPALTFDDAEMARLGKGGTMRRLILAAALVAAWAWQGRADDTVVLGRPGLSNVFVWRDTDAYAEAMKLLKARVQETHPELVMQLLACIVTPGDHAVVLDAGMFSHTVMVVDGAKAGCRGLVTTEDVDKLR